MDAINRRQALTTSAAVLGGLTTRAASAHATPSPTTRPTRRGPWLEARDGAQLFHLDWGTGRPVVFLHAWALSSDIWEYQMCALVERGLRCIALDRRGHGRSPDPGRNYDANTLADDVATLLDTLDLHDVTLVGYSMGGGEVARYLARHGARRIARTVLISSITPLVGRRPDNPDGTPPEATEAWLATLRADRPAAVAAGMPLFTGDRPISPAMDRWLQDQFLRTSPRAGLEITKTIATADFRPDLRAFTMPTLLLHGDADLVNPLDRTARRTAAAIPRATLKLYPGGAHGLPITDRTQVTADLLQFIG